MALETEGQRRWWFAHLRLTEGTDAVDDRGKAAIKSYKNFGYSMVNKRLRETTTGLGEGADAQADAIVRDLDHALQQSRLPQGLVVFRGFEHAGVAKHPERLVGKTIESPAFLSTSFDRDVVHERFMHSKESVGLRLRVPAGVGAVATDRFAPQIKSEREVLLQRGLRVKVHGVTYHKGKPYLDGEVVR